MTYRDYMMSHEGENLSWCRPYVSDNGEHALIVYDGEALCLMSPTIIADRSDGTLTDDVLEQFAREVNPDYDVYGHGWSDLEIATNGTLRGETGCAHCPWRDECEAMGEEMEEE